MAGTQRQTTNGAPRETIKAILDATLRVVGKGGVDAVRYREVAREADVPVGTVSYNFPARTDLIRAAFGLFLEESRSTVEAVRAREPSETLDELAELLTALSRAYLADRERCLTEYDLMVYAGRDPELYESLAAWDRARQSELAVELERLEMPRPNATAQTIADTIRGFQLSSLGQPRPDFDGFQRRLRDILHALGGASDI